MSKALVQRIQELTVEPIYIGDTDADLHREIAENCWCISASDEERSQVTPAELAAAIDELIEYYRAKVSSRYSGYGAIFYTWFDGQACQLRCCIISGIHTKLPFGCDIERIPSILPIIEDFLASPEIIPWSDLIEVDWSEPEDISDTAMPLKVYVVQIA